MKKRPVECIRILPVLAVLGIFGPACILSGSATGQVIVVTATKEAGETAGQGPGQADATPSETVPAALPTFTPTYTIVHLATPPGTTGTTRYITDFKTKDYAPQKKAVAGDEYSNNRWERPFTAETMEYLADVDLIRVEMRITAPWVYLTFEFVEPRAEGIGETMYGAEFDLNRDGRGEYLIWGVSPADGEWTTDGVEIWQDTNYDVGGATPQGTNAPWDKGDGYDRNLFAAGVGDDPDLAWIRQIEGGKKVQLAFKYSVLNNAAQFLWNGLADLGVRKPAWFDYNDHFTQEQAGSPFPIQTKFYPLKEIFGLDNTCRDAYGFTPTGTEAGLCMYYGSISGTVFRDYNEDGILNSGEPGLSLGTVTLGRGACPTSGLNSMVPSGSGAYAFADLLIGAYCVHLNIMFAEPSHHMTTPVSATLTLAPGDAKVVNFGINWIDPPA
jgi:hypothetical protein